MAQTQVNRVMDAITSVESGLESVETRASDMQKSLGSKVGTESTKLYDAVKVIAGREADTIVADARTKAESESVKIKQSGADATSKIQANIDANFEDTVDYVVSKVLKEE